VTDKRARRRGREIALQVLYQTDSQPQLTAEEALRLYASHFGRPSADDTDAGVPALQPQGSAPDEAFSDEELGAARHLAERLVRGVVADRGEVDDLVQRASRNWRLERMARVDRNLLRLGAWELMRASDVPAKVAINEAIEIAKRFGTAESAAFVNGILDRCLDELGRKPGQTPESKTDAGAGKPKDPA
jgi:N utilization substance protein B